MRDHRFAKTWRLTRFIARLDRFKIPVWLIAFTFFTLIVPVAFQGLYESQAERDAMAQTMENPAMIAMVGHGDLENYTVGAMTTHQMLLMTAVVAGLMSILLLARHTRGDEEDGRIELIRSLPTGRLSYLNAALLVITLTSIALALVTGFGLYALGIDTITLEGSLLYGASLGGTALVFAGVTAVSAQLAETSRGTIGLAIALLLGGYLFRGITDISNEALSILSPLDWATKTEAFSGNHWWPVLLMIGVSVILFIVANLLLSIRDMERGFLPARSGRRHASFLLTSSLGLSWRLQRAGFLYWLLAMFVLGISYGSVMGDMDSFFEGNELYQQMLFSEEGYSMIEQFIPLLIVIMSIMATIPPVMAMNKLRSEEKKDRIEQLLARSVSRFSLMGSHLLLACMNAAIMLYTAMFGFWIAADLSMDEGIALGTLTEAFMAYLPATLVMVGLAAFLTGVFPKWTSFVWAYLFYSFFVLYLGTLLDFPEWTNQLSPFGHIPQAPIEDITAMPLIIASLIAASLMAAGLIGFRKRDIRT
ncbi:ABC transporter permease [Salisediminibacterium beveridgei]|uniref:Putative ABC transporter permease protein n=1 Tax=Salisediminibacterium beveridgei TaxID=632773 RepID=A0A1D7QT25_9BACI|nr:ABC transporter permease [Salisediminibacterium beveridgei]AOM82155.1 putative ABC transporter permease protein [Salisediminibacterium beveridgei]